MQHDPLKVNLPAGIKPRTKGKNLEPWGALNVPLLIQNCLDKFKYAESSIQIFLEKNSTDFFLHLCYFA